MYQRKKAPWKKRRQKKYLLQLVWNGKSMKCWAVHFLWFLGGFSARVYLYVYTRIYVTSATTNLSQLNQLKTVILLISQIR